MFFFVCLVCSAIVRSCRSKGTARHLKKRCTKQTDRCSGCCDSPTSEKSITDVMDEESIDSSEDEDEDGPWLDIYGDLLAPSQNKITEAEKAPLLRNVDVV